MARRRYPNQDATGPVTVDIAAGTASGDASVGIDHFTNVFSVRGSAFDDHLYGSDSNNSFNGWGGNDFIDGRGGFDTVFYSSVVDDDNITGPVHINLASGIVTGNNFTDTLRSIESVRGTQSDDVFDATGFSGSSTNAGSNGTFNVFEGAGGNDTIIGNGNTTIQFSTLATSGVTVNLATGTATGDSSVGTDTFTGVNGVNGSPFDDTIIGDSNNNTLAGYAGNDHIDGGPGIDTVNYMSDPSGVVVNLATGTASDGFGTTDTLVNMENINGSNFDDTLTGDTNNNAISGNGGNDSIFGGDGNDILNGGAGNDFLNGGTGNNVLTGGPGADTFFFAPGVGSDRITDFDASSQPGHDVIELQNSGYTDLASLLAASAISQHGADTVITLGAHSITLTGVTATNLTPDHFLFV